MGPDPAQVLTAHHPGVFPGGLWAISHASYKTYMMGRLRLCVSAIMDSRERLEAMKFTVEYEQEADGRWLAEVKELPGVLAYGKDPEDATAHAQALALRVIADRLENGESTPSLLFTFSSV